MKCTCCHQPRKAHQIAAQDKEGTNGQCWKCFDKKTVAVHRAKMTPKQRVASDAMWRAINATTEAEIRLHSEDDWINNAENVKLFKKWMKENDIPFECTVDQWNKYCLSQSEKWQKWGKH